jgi:hypothetical protein
MEKLILLKKLLPPEQAVFISKMNQQILGKKHTNKRKYNNLIIIQRVVNYLQQKALPPLQSKRDNLGKKGEKIYVIKVRK